VVTYGDPGDTPAFGDTNGDGYAEQQVIRVPGAVVNPPASALRADIVRIAESHLGNGYATYSSNSTTNWCALFATKVTERAGASDIDVTSWVYDVWKEAVRGQRFTPAGGTPQRGDLVIWKVEDRRSTPNTTSHVAIVVEVHPTNGTIKTIGGNEGPGEKPSTRYVRKSGWMDPTTARSGFRGYVRPSA
jgi:hypothetical protein